MNIVTRIRRPRRLPTLAKPHRGLGKARQAGDLQNDTTKPEKCKAKPDLTLEPCAVIQGRQTPAVSKTLLSHAGVTRNKFVNVI